MSSVLVIETFRSSLLNVLLQYAYFRLSYARVFIFYRYDPQTNQWSCDVAPTTSCRTSVGVAVLDGFLYAVGGQDGVQCLNHVERLDHTAFEFSFMLVSLKS